jgi:hypothetical protein
MGTKIGLKDLWGAIQNGTPTEEGIRLAKALLARGDIDWSDITIDFRGMPFDFLNLSFFYGFLQQIHDTRSDLLESARKVKWKLSYGVLEELIASFVTDFQPRPSKNAA